MPIDKITLASSSGLLSAYNPTTTHLDSLNKSTILKLGPPPKTDKLKEQVVVTLQEGANTNSNGDIEMAQPNGEEGQDVEMKQQILIKEVEPDVDPEVTSPEAGETFPPIPQVFRTADLKREVEAVRDKRRMIRLGPGANIGKSVGPTTVLPSVVAFTVFDGGEG